MEFSIDHKLKKGETEKIPIPNLKFHCLIPSKLKFTVQELEFIFYSQNTQLFKYGEPYFRIYNEIDLSNYTSIIGDGQDLTMSIRNLSKKELELGVSIVYTKHHGNIIYSNTFSYDALLENCLKDIQDNGQITQLLIDVEQPISSVILDPIYKLTAAASGLGVEEMNNWSTPLAIQNDKPSKRVMIDFTDPDLKGYVKYLKFYRLKLLFGEPDKKENNKIHLIAYGYK